MQGNSTGGTARRGLNPLHLAWGIGSLGTITMVTAISNLYLFFLISVLKIAPAAAGFVIFVSKLFDTVSDPLVGWWSDRSNTRWGRRRPFMLAGALLSPLALILLFQPPAGLDGAAQQGVILAILLLYAAALTLFNVPYLAMPAEMTDDYHERSSIMSFRAAFLVGGGFLGGAVAGPIIARAGGGREGYAILGFILAGIVLAAMMTTVVFTRTARFRSYQRPTISRIRQARLFLANSPFLLLAGVKALQFLQLAASGASTLFFFISIMERDESLLFPFGSSVIAGSLLSIRLWLPVIRRWGKKPVMMLALLCQAALYLSWLAAGPDEPMGFLLARGAALGVMGGAILIASQSMIVDTIEFDRRLSGLNREGLYSSVFSFVEKMMHATGPLIIGVLLAWFGYDANLPRGAPQPDSARLAIFLGQAVIPAACSLGMAAVLAFYRLDEETLKAARRHPLGEAEDAPPATEPEPEPETDIQPAKGAAT